MDLTFARLGVFALFLTVALQETAEEELLTKTTPSYCEEYILCMGNLTAKETSCSSNSTTDDHVDESCREANQLRANIKVLSNDIRQSVVACVTATPTNASETLPSKCKSGKGKKSKKDEGEDDFSSCREGLRALRTKCAKAATCCSAARMCKSKFEPSDEVQQKRKLLETAAGKCKAVKEAKKLADKTAKEAAKQKKLEANKKAKNAKDAAPSGISTSSDGNSVTLPKNVFDQLLKKAHVSQKELEKTTAKEKTTSTTIVPPNADAGSTKAGNAKPELPKLAADLPAVTPMKSSVGAAPTPASAGTVASTTPSPKPESKPESKLESKHASITEAQPNVKTDKAVETSSATPAISSSSPKMAKNGTAPVENKKPTTDGPKLAEDKSVSMTTSPTLDSNTTKSPSSEAIASTSAPNAINGKEAVSTDKPSSDASSSTPLATGEKPENATSSPANDNNSTKTPSSNPTANTSPPSTGNGAKTADSGKPSSETSTTNQATAGEKSENVTPTTEDNTTKSPSGATANTFAPSTGNLTETAAVSSKPTGESQSALNATASPTTDPNATKPTEQPVAEPSATTASPNADTSTASAEPGKPTADAKKAQPVLSADVQSPTSVESTTTSVSRSDSSPASSTPVNSPSNAGTNETPTTEPSQTSSTETTSTTLPAKEANASVPATESTAQPSSSTEAPKQMPSEVPTITTGSSLATTTPATGKTTNITMVVSFSITEGDSASNSSVKPEISINLPENPMVVHIKPTPKLNKSATPIEEELLTSDGAPTTAPLVATTPKTESTTSPTMSSNKFEPKKAAQPKETPKTR